MNDEVEELKHLKERVSAIELAIEKISLKIEGLQFAAPHIVEAAFAKKPKVREAKHEVNDRRKQAQLPPKRNEVQSSGGSARFLGAVGVICFVLAASYFVKLAIDEGWLTPLRQLIGLSVFGLTLIAAGFRLRQDDRPYASLLPATGVVVLFLAAFAGHLYFHVYGISLAIVLVNVVSVFSIFLFSLFKENFYALASTVGTYLVPVLVGVNHLSLNSVSIYFIFWGVTFTSVAILQRSRIFIGVAAYMAIFTAALLAFSHFRGTQETLFATFQAVQFALFCVATAWYSIRNKEPLSKAESWAFFPVLLLFYITEYGLIHRISASNAPWFSLGFAAVVYAIYYLATKLLRKSSLQSFPMVAAFLSLVTLHALYLNIIPDFLSAWFALLLLAAFSWLGRKGFKAEDHWVSILILGWIVGVEYSRVLFDHTPSLKVIGINFSYAILLYLLSRGHKTGVGKFISMLAVAQLLFGLKHLCYFAFDRVEAGFATSALWSMAALLFLFVAKSKRNKETASFAVWLFVFVAAKVLLFDLSSSGATAQIVALLVIGALFYAGGYIYRQIGDSK